MAEPKQQTIFTRIQSVLDSCIADGVPGISAAIHTTSGETHHFQAGHADIISKCAANKNTAFGIGSITKVFVAVVILQLIEDQKLSLNETVSSILGTNDFLDKDPHAGKARIEDLLSHTSAIASWEDDADWIPDGRGRNLQPEKLWAKDETLRYVKPSASAELEKATFHYANTNYTLLGLIIEHITHNTAESEIRARILQPLGMEHTYVEGFEQPRPLIGTVSPPPRRYHRATPTFLRTPGLSPHFSFVPPPPKDDLIDVTASNLSVSWMAGGMISTPSDLIKFATALQQRKSRASGGLLTRASMATLMDWHPADQEKEMGHGIFRLRHPVPEVGRRWVGHNGGVLGFSAALWWTIDEGDVGGGDDGGDFGADDAGDVAGGGGDAGGGGCIVAILCNVGSSHSGPEAPPTPAHSGPRNQILQLAAEL